MSDTKLGSDSSHYLKPLEALKLIEATSFYNQLSGETFNVHLTIQYEGLGIRDPKAATRFHGELNESLSRWLRRQKERAWGGQPTWEHAYIYVHENARDRGLHTHQLMWAPYQLRRELRAKIARRLEEWSRENSIQVEPTAVDLRCKWRRDEGGQVALQWRWVRYLLKSVSDDFFPVEDLFPNEEGVRVPLRELLKLERHQPSWPTGCAQRCGMSHNISTAAQRAFFDELKECPSPSSLYSGWELYAFRRRRERKRSDEAWEGLRSLDL